MANTVVYNEEWATKLQERLKRPTNWREVCDVRFTDTRVLNVPYMSTTPATVALTRGTAVAFDDFALTNEALTISTGRQHNLFIDWADIAQADFNLQMDLADRQGQLINERIEVDMLASHASFTDLGDTGGGAVGLNASPLTVSANNIDDIIRAIKREIRVANGWSLATQKGIFVIWRPADFELLEAFVQANGFTVADAALKDGTLEGFRYMGVDHYVSNDHTANHLFAGVKKMFILGICRSTWGKVHKIENPPGATGGILSGVGMHTRSDSAFLSTNTADALLYDVNVA